MQWSILCPTKRRGFQTRYLVLFGVINPIFCGLYGLNGRDKTTWTEWV